MHARRDRERVDPDLVAAIEMSQRHDALGRARQRASLRALHDHVASLVRRTAGSRSK
jgi:hypothetical protein